MNIMHSKTVKFITQLRHTMQGRTTQHKQTSKVSEYQIISQPKLDKFNVTANVGSDGQNSIIVAESETHVYMKASSATRQFGARTLGVHRVKSVKKGKNNITP